jgi:uncharacterized membrane-anchored protein YhcB (DUF1043 family)
MGKGLLIGGSVIVAGVFVGFVAYRIAKKNPKLLKNARKKVSKQSGRSQKDSKAQRPKSLRHKTSVTACCTSKNNQW